MADGMWMAQTHDWCTVMWWAIIMWDCPSLQVYKPLYFSIVLHPIPYPQSIPSCDFNRLWASSKITCSPLTLIFYSLSASLCVTTLILPLSPLPPSPCTWSPTHLFWPCYIFWFLPSSHFTLSWSLVLAANSPPALGLALHNKPLDSTHILSLDLPLLLPHFFKQLYSVLFTLCSYSPSAPAVPGHPLVC